MQNANPSQISRCGGKMKDNTYEHIAVHVETTRSITMLATCIQIANILLQYGRLSRM